MYTYRIHSLCTNCPLAFLRRAKITRSIFKLRFHTKQNPVPLAKKERKPTYYTRQIVAVKKYVTLVVHIHKKLFTFVCSNVCFFYVCECLCHFCGKSGKFYLYFNALAFWWLLNWVICTFSFSLSLLNVNKQNSNVIKLHLQLDL